MKNIVVSSSPTRQEYFDDLCSIVGIDSFNGASYFLLARELFYTEFYGFVGNDINREDDGRELRDDFVRTRKIKDDEELIGPCSVLEMLIALSMRMLYIIADDVEDFEESDYTVRKFFWEMVRNLGLDSLSDPRWLDENGPSKVHDVTERLMDRRYSPDGRGGLFPLKNSNRDQRNIEIWYQMSSYILENYSFL